MKTQTRSIHGSTILELIVAITVAGLVLSSAAFTGSMSGTMPPRRACNATANFLEISRAHALAHQISVEVVSAAEGLDAKLPTSKPSLSLRLTPLRASIQSGDGHSLSFHPNLSASPATLTLGTANSHLTQCVIKISIRGRIRVSDA